MVAGASLARRSGETGQRGGEEMQGVKYMGEETWYGPGYCGICGDTENLVSRPTRWWDPDDGWRMGVLCVYCTRDAEKHGPEPGDYAYRQAWRGEVVDELTFLGDADGAWAEVQDW